MRLLLDVMQVPIIKLGEYNECYYLGLNKELTQNEQILDYPI